MDTKATDIKTALKPQCAITKKEQYFLDTYMRRVNAVWSEWFATRGSYGGMSMKEREEILGKLRDKLHRLQTRV